VMADCCRRLPPLERIEFIMTRRLPGSFDPGQLILVHSKFQTVEARSGVSHAALPRFGHVGSAPDRVRIPQVGERRSVPQQTG